MKDSDTVAVVFNGEPCTFKGVSKAKGDKENVTVAQQKLLASAGVIVTEETK